MARSLDREEEGEEQAVCSAVVWALDVFMLAEDRRSLDSISVGELYRRYGELSAIVVVMLLSVLPSFAEHWFCGHRQKVLDIRNQENENGSWIR